jgi:DNA processing protein
MACRKNSSFPRNKADGRPGALLRAVIGGADVMNYFNQKISAPVDRREQHMSNIEWIALNSVKGLGPVRIKHLIDRYGSAEEVFRHSATEFQQEGLIPASCISGMFGREVIAEAERQAAIAEKKGVAVLTLASPSYPPYLKEIFAPPPVLFIRGDAAVFSQPCIGVVGTRSPTVYGKGVTRSLTRELVEEGLVIASGLARGIDTVAHETCLEQGGSTIAVLGCGIDILYPSDNEALAEKICATGALVSEFPLGTRPEPYNFPRRNRIISGLSAGVLVIEGGERSGGLITATYAVQQGRDVFAVPGPINSPQSTGPFNLIKEGAIPARSGREIAEALSLFGNHLPAKAGAAPSPDGSVQLSLLSESERSIFETLSETPRRMDELSDIAGKPVMELFDALLMLELKGLVRQLSGQQYIRI